MVDPHVLGSLDADRIASVREDLAHGQVANDDIGNVLDVEGDTFQLGGRIQAEDRFVTGNTSLRITLDSALDEDDHGLRCLHGSSELSK